MAKANNNSAAGERKISESRLNKVRQDIKSKSTQLSTWVKKVEVVSNDLSSQEDTLVNRPVITVMENDLAFYQSKADRLKKEVDSLSKTLSTYISKNSRIDDKRLGIDIE